jgi:hypothetical protein
MKMREKKNISQAERNEKAYVSKRNIMRAAGPAIKKASKAAMETAGYVVKVENDWVIREFKNGKKERIKQLQPVRSNRIFLD